jgi:proteasome activator subunit 3 (PA28 gamma)
MISFTKLFKSEVIIPDNSRLIMFFSIYSSFQVQEYKDSLIKKAEELIVTGFPKKIVHLNEQLETAQFAERNFSEVYQELNIPVPDPISISDLIAEGEPSKKRARVEIDQISGTKVMALPSGTVTCNKPICDLISIVKPVIRALVEDCKYSVMF